MAHKYDATQVLDQLRSDLDRRAASFEQVHVAASQYEEALVEYAQAFKTALDDGWTRSQLSHLPSVPKAPKVAEQAED